MAFREFKRKKNGKLYSNDEISTKRITFLMCSVAYNACRWCESG